MLSSRLFRAATVGALLLAVPVTAHAQLGGLMKKAAEKAIEKKAGGSGGGSESASCRSVSFDRTVVELTPTRIDAIVKALGTVYAGPKGAKRRSLQSQLDAAEARLHELQNDESISKAEESQREWKSCRQDAYQAIVNARVEKEGAGIMTKWMKAMREHNEKISAAQARGDSVGAAALTDSTQLVMVNVVAPTAADSAMVEKRCGKPPRISKRVAERDSLRVVVREMEDEIRAMDEDAEEEMIKASGLTATQLAMARERLTTFVKENRTCGFTKAEVDAIAARRAELEPLL
jgi:hypothetical protein